MYWEPSNHIQPLHHHTIPGAPHQRYAEVIFLHKVHIHSQLGSNTGGLQWPGTLKLSEPHAGTVPFKTGDGNQEWENAENCKVEFRHFVFFIYFDMWFLDILGYRKWNPHLITLLHNARNMDGEQKVLTLFPWTKWKHQWNALENLENLDWGSNRSCRKDWMAETYSGNNSWDKYGGHCRKKTNVPFRTNSTSSQPCWNHWNQNVSFWLVEQTCHNRVVLLFGYVLWDTVGTSIIPNTQRKRAKYLRGPPRVAGPTWTIEVGNGWLMAPAPTFGTYIPFGNQTWLVNRVYSWENH